MHVIDAVDFESAQCIAEPRTARESAARRIPAGAALSPELGKPGQGGPPRPSVFYSSPAGHAGKCASCGERLLSGECITCDRCDRGLDDFGGDLF